MKQLFFILITFFFFSVKAQQTESVDFEKIEAIVDFGYNLSYVSVGMKIEFNILKKTDTIFVDAKKMNIELVKLEKENSKYFTENFKQYYNDSRLYIIYPFKKKKKFVLTINYTAKPEKAMYFLDKDDSKQIWTQGQGKYTSNWLPSIDDMNDKIEFDLSITYENGYEVLTNGKFIKKDSGEKLTEWHYDMQKPMSSYLVALAIGKYNKKIDTSKSGIPLEMYYYPEDSAKVEPTYRYTKSIFDFLEEEIGVAYPWQNYKQVPAKDFLYSGMENTSLTIFSDDFMIDNNSFVDKNYVNVNAHELAHQWFGNLVTETEGKHHWLQEGFATYYALLAERDIFGDDYYFWRLYEYAQELLIQEKTGQATTLLDPKASSTTFYKKGALVLHMLRNKVGDKPFKKAIKNYLEKYAFKNVETENFITEVEKSSGMNLTAFQKKWLVYKILPYNEIETHLTSVSNVVNGYLQIDCEVYSSKCSDYLTSYIFDASKIKVIQQMPNKIKPEDFKNSIKVRQAIAQHVNAIPLVLKADYETLLNDPSYVTIEAALYNLWQNFPEERKVYLDQTKAVFGFNDYNVRTLWLALASNTLDYHEDIKQEYYTELVSYTAPQYSFQLRQNAMLYLKAIDAFNKPALKNVIEASTHHNWRFKSFARDLLKSLAEKENYKVIIATLQAK